jgi:hypothetical protein
MPANTIVPAAWRTDMSGVAEMIEVVMMSEARTFISFEKESDGLYDGHCAAGLDAASFILRLAARCEIDPDQP